MTIQQFLKLEESDQLEIWVAFQALKPAEFEVFLLWFQDHLARRELRQLVARVNQTFVLGNSCSVAE
ncbi:hypothetical protein [Paenibacillus cremeus]|uniref:Uncharacterized protein n=1 Tax=Paenibacillus cremeus TaxID=2163881 RepID=A0A559K5V6_9BACL|nr:hypothetical protein [Paenibacillus cremeus]TVY07490.1 hypothetical protein FPZ49_23685 [Paenibacillus cremeus]